MIKIEILKDYKEKLSNDVFQFCDSLKNELNQISINSLKIFAVDDFTNQLILNASMYSLFNKNDQSIILLKKLKDLYDHSNIKHMDYRNNPFFIFKNDYLVRKRDNQNFANLFLLIEACYKTSSKSSNF